MCESGLIDLFGVGNDPLKESQLDDLLFRLESENSTVDHLAGFPLSSFTITVSENPEKPDSTPLM
jgi:hypothetical protein